MKSFLFTIKKWFGTTPFFSSAQELKQILLHLVAVSSVTRLNGVFLILVYLKVFILTSMKNNITSVQSSKSRRIRKRKIYIVRKETIVYSHIIS
jgi:hypothetical protein